MASWDPDRYLAFATERLRPAQDLMARVALERPRAIFDLGCGPGNVTKLLAELWPEARVTGVDSSPAMLARARAGVPGATFLEADLATWAPPEPADLLFSNAALHWVADHPALLRRLMARLAKGGVLAVQMPRNFEAPSHQAILATVAEEPWRRRLAGVALFGPVAPAAWHWRNLAPLAARVEVWETEYLHALAGPDPVLEWLRGTALRPILDALDEGEAHAFLAACGARLRAAYPAVNGLTLFPFRRLFILAQASQA